MRLITKIIIPAVVGGLFLFFISEPGVNTLWAISNTGVFDSKASDQELITKAKQLPEVRAFLAKYPNVTSSISKVDDIDVSFGGGDASRNGGSLTLTAYFGRSSLQFKGATLVCYSSIPLSNSTHAVPDPRFFYVNDSQITSYLQSDREEKCFN